MKLLRLPQNDHLWQSIERLSGPACEYFSTLSSIISTYNMSFPNEESPLKFPKYKENGSYITSKPEEI